MAKQIGIIKIKGTIDGITFYTSKNQDLARKKGGASKERIATEKEFQRTRENSSEFGMATQAGKLFRNALLGMIRTSSDYQVTSRVAKLMTQIKDLDHNSIRGQRHVADGIKTPEGKAILQGFNFNENAPLKNILLKNYTLDVISGQLDITGLYPGKDVEIAPGATHITIRSAWTKIDFGKDITKTEFSEVVTLPIEDIAHDVHLSFESAPSLTDAIGVFVLQILFWQELNGSMYFLNNTNHNCMEVIGVV
ncbi:MAG: hypothetical protein H7X99_04445 [Saprospiraceae bacterium]|nr:hypothetical protein [Saprospiraceae bacterium]